MNIKDIPNFLMKSSLYEIIRVPKKFILNSDDLNINDDMQLLKVINSLLYWNTYNTPFEVYDYVLTYPEYGLDQSKLILRGDLLNSQLVMQEINFLTNYVKNTPEDKISNQELVEQTIKANLINILRYLKESEKVAILTMKNINTCIKFDRLDCFKYFISQIDEKDRGFYLNYDGLLMICEYGRLNFLKYLNEIGLLFAKYVTYTGYTNDPNCKNRYRLLKPFSSEFVEYNQLECLKYFVNLGVKFIVSGDDYGIFSKCIKTNNSEILKLMLDNACNTVSDSLVTLTEERENGILTITHQYYACELATKYNSLECLLLLRRYGFGWHNTCEIAAKHNKLAILRYAYNSGAPFKMWEDIFVRFGILKNRNDDYIIDMESLISKKLKQD